MDLATRVFWEGSRELMMHRIVCEDRFGNVSSIDGMDATKILMLVNEWGTYSFSSEGKEVEGTLRRVVYRYPDTIEKNGDSYGRLNFEIELPFKKFAEIGKPSRLVERREYISIENKITVTPAHSPSTGV